MVYVSLQSGSWVLLCSQIHSTLYSTRIDCSRFWTMPLEHRPGAESVSPLKEKKRKGSWINPPHICSRFWIKTIPRFIWLPEKREKKKKKKKKKSSCVCGKTFSSAIPQAAWELPGVCLKEVYFFAKIYGKHSLCLSASNTMPTLCSELQLQHVRRTETSFHLTLTIAKKIRWFKLHGSHPLLTKHIWSSFHSLHSCRFPAILLKLARTWLCCHHTSDYWTV